MRKKLQIIGMKNLISILFLIFAFHFLGQKYPKTLIIENDTLVCFNLSQSKQIAIWNEERKLCQEIHNLDKQEIIKKEQVIVETNKIVVAQNEIIENNKLIIVEKDKLISIHEEEIKILKKQVRRQKTGKWIAIIGGVFLSGIMLAI